MSNNLPPACAKDWVLLKMTDEITQLTVNLKTGVTGPQCADPEGGALSFTAETTSGEIGGVTYTLSLVEFKPWNCSIFFKYTTYRIF